MVCFRDPGGLTNISSSSINSSVRIIFYFVANFALLELLLDILVLRPLELVRYCEYSFFFNWEKPCSPWSMERFRVKELSCSYYAFRFRCSLLISFLRVSFSFFSLLLSSLIFLFSSLFSLTSSLSFATDYSESLNYFYHFFFYLWYSSTICSFSISSSSTRSSTLSMCSFNCCYILICFLISASRS